MNTAILIRAIGFSAMLSLSVCSAQAQVITDSKNRSMVTASEDVAGSPSNGPAVVGKEMPVPGGVLFVTPAERASMQKEMSAKEALSNKEKRRLKRLKKQDRKEVTDVIGSSVNTYLANAATVHTLQRF